MNLELLFKEQQLLRDKIAYDKPDRFEKLILALLVELGECANEWRRFKFWSKDQEPRTKIDINCFSCDGSGVIEEEPCLSCVGGKVGYENPLLEEYVDGFHFVLELGIELKLTNPDIKPFKWKNLLYQYTSIMNTASDLLFGELHPSNEIYSVLVNEYMGLGEMLGFTWEQIEQAYFEKNAVNHQRQEDGY
ncbi:dUTP diphosphatase [Bacillus cereus]|uniref:dUTP diphosphatase n=1 Tax=Bacillaceae TaxID=186817 RepID=UPI003812F473